jgi:methanethiol S-methyltransferase
MMVYLLVASLWIAYCALHSYLISIGFTNLMMRRLKSYYAFYRLFYVLLSVILLVPLIEYTGQTDTRIVLTYAHSWSFIRYALVGSALVIFFWAFFFNYDSLSFFGVRQILNFGKTEKADSSGALRRNGLLGIVRHPMYFALILYLWCQTFRVMDILTNVILTIYVVIGTMLEERKLVLEFGDAYREYQRDVPMLIPFVKARRV